MVLFLKCLNLNWVIPAALIPLTYAKQKAQNDRPDLNNELNFMPFQEVMRGKNQRARKVKPMDIDKLAILSGTCHPDLSKEISSVIKRDLQDTVIKRFNDGEVSISISNSLRGKNVFIVQPCGNPVSDSIMELLLLISTARRDGAKRVTAVIPYFPFKHHRHKMPFSEKFSSKFLFSEPMDFAKMLQEMGVDKVISLDLQRPGQGAESCFFNTKVPSEVISSFNVMLGHFIDQVCPSLKGPIVIIAPNEEMLKKALKFQSRLRKDFPGRVIHIQGFVHSGYSSINDAKPLEPLNSVEVKDANVVIVDDMVDSASTVSQLSKTISAKGAKNIYVCASHGLFNGNAIQLIEDSPITHVFVTNSLPLDEMKRISTKITQISIAHLLAEVIWTEHFQKNLMDDEQFEIE